MVTELTIIKSMKQDIFKGLTLMKSKVAEYRHRINCRYRSRIILSKCLTEKFHT